MGQLRRYNSGIIRLVLSLMLTLLAVGAYLYRQDIVDYYQYYRFEPSPDVRELAYRGGMSDQGRFYFYTSRPQINDRDSFNRNCGSLVEQSVVLGCYSAQRIYVFDIDDMRLDGIREVTAAHEMLHAVYERMSDGERGRINKLLDAEAAKITDTRLKELIALYERTEPQHRHNELHSIIATEVRDIDPELEAYYGRYFTDRSIVVSHAERYEAVFREIRDRQNQLVEELNSLVGRINQLSSEYNVAVEQLNSDVVAFNKKAQTGDFESQDEFISQRNSLIARQSQLARDKLAIDDLTNRYQILEAELKEVNADAVELNESLDSTLVPLTEI